MGWGGRRRGAGRKPGSVNKRTRLLALLGIAKEKATPFEIMIDIANTLWRAATREQGKVDVELAMKASEAAERAAPYLHPRVGSILPASGGTMMPLQDGQRMLAPGAVIRMPNNGKRLVPRPPPDANSLIIFEELPASTKDVDRASQPASTEPSAAAAPDVEREESSE